MGVAGDAAILLSWPAIAALGALGGLAQAIYLHGKIDMPRYVREAEGTSLYLGFLNYIILGAISSACYLALFPPAGALKQVATAILSGFGSGSVLARYAMSLERGKAEVLGNVLAKQGEAKGAAIGGKSGD